MCVTNSTESFSCADISRAENTIRRTFDRQIKAYLRDSTVRTLADGSDLLAFFGIRTDTAPVTSPTSSNHAASVRRNSVAGARTTLGPLGGASGGGASVHVSQVSPAPSHHSVESLFGGDRLSATSLPSIDVIIMDVNMIKVHGVEAAQRLRAAGISVPIILATNGDTSSLLSSVKDLEGVRVIPKPDSAVRLIVPILDALHPAWQELSVATPFSSTPGA